MEVRIDREPGLDLLPRRWAERSGVGVIM